MATYTYQDTTPIVPNTVMRIRLRDGVPYQYLIKPVDGYVLHDSTYDTYDMDFSTMTEYLVCLGYRTTEGSVAASYDFSTGTMLDDEGNEVTYYGSRQFFTKLASEVPENQIYGGGNNAEIM